VGAGFGLGLDAGRFALVDCGEERAGVDPFPGREPAIELGIIDGGGIGGLKQGTGIEPQGRPEPFEGVGCEVCKAPFELRNQDPRDPRGRRQFLLGPSSLRAFNDKINH
jgi:hypothetical protein